MVLVAAAITSKPARLHSAVVWLVINVKQAAVVPSQGDVLLALLGRLSCQASSSSSSSLAHDMMDVPLINMQVKLASSHCQLAPYTPVGTSRHQAMAHLVGLGLQRQQGCLAQQQKGLWPAWAELQLPAPCSWLLPAWCHSSVCHHINRFRSCVIDCHLHGVSTVQVNNTGHVVGCFYMVSFQFLTSGQTCQFQMISSCLHVV